MAKEGDYSSLLRWYHSNAREIAAVMETVDINVVPVELFDRFELFSAFVDAS